MSSPSYEGGCLCGAVRYRIVGAPLFVCYCHCRSCTLASGAQVVAWVTVARDQFEIVRGEVQENRSSDPVRRTFCPACGSALTYTHEKRPDDMDVTLATIDDATGLEPQCHVWVSQQRPWAPIVDDLPKFSEWFDSPQVS